MESDEPWLLSTELPEGNYDVVVRFRDATAAAAATIKADLRRLMLEVGSNGTESSDSRVRRFTVNVNNATIAPRHGMAMRKVELLPMERQVQAHACDGCLTLEIHAERSAVHAVDILPVNVPTVFLLGDSSVADQFTEPYASWGQMLPRFFKPGIAVANHSESGEDQCASSSRRRIDKVVASMKPGDLVLIQPGHSDHKRITNEFCSSFATSKCELHTHIEVVRGSGGVPVLVTPIERYVFDELSRVSNGCNGCVEAARRMSKELDLPLIDLNAMCQQLFRFVGSMSSILPFGAEAGGETQDSRYTSYEAYLLAGLVAHGLRKTRLPVVQHLVDDLEVDPLRPVQIDQFAVPNSPVTTTSRPAVK